VAARRVVRLKEREVSRRSHSPEDFPSQGRRRGGEHTTETRGEGGQVPCEKGKGRQGEEGRARISNEQRPRGRDRKRASPRRAHSRETGAYRAHCPRHIRGIRVLRLVCPPAPLPLPPFATWSRRPARWSRRSEKQPFPRSSLAFRGSRLACPIRLSHPSSSQPPSLSSLAISFPFSAVSFLTFALARERMTDNSRSRAA